MADSDIQRETKKWRRGLLDGTIPLPGSGASVQASWRFSTTTTAGDPGNGRFRLNNADASLATQIYIDNLTNGGFDFSAIFSALQAGDKIYIQNDTDATESFICTVGTVVDNTGWFTINIGVDTTGADTSWTNNSVFGFLFFSSGGATTPGGLDNEVQFNDGGAFGGFGSWDGTKFFLDTTEKFNINSQAADNVSLVADSGSVQIGNFNGIHIAFDRNHIQQKQTGTTAGALNINNLGGEVIFGNAIALTGFDVNVPTAGFRGNLDVGVISAAADQDITINAAAIGNTHIFFHQNNVQRAAIEYLDVDDRLHLDSTEVEVDGIFYVFNTLGIQYIYDSDTSGSAALARIGFRDSAGANMGNMGFSTADGHLQISNQLAGGDIRLLTIANGMVELTYGGVVQARTAATGSGGFEVNNTVTGAGFERVLTTSDAGGGTIGGSIANDQIAFGAVTANTIEGSANLTFNGTDFFVLATDVILESDSITAGAANPWVWESQPEGITMYGGNATTVRHALRLDGAVSDAFEIVSVAASTTLDVAGTTAITLSANRAEALNIIAGNPGAEATGILLNGVLIDSAFKVSAIGGGDQAQQIIHRHSTTITPQLIAARSNSDTNAHAVVVDDQELFAIRAVGWAGTTYEEAARINFVVDGTPGANDMPGRIEFLTTADGADTPTLNMTLDALGALSVPNAPTVTLGNYVFDTNQAVGAGQDNFVLTYDNGTGQISLEAATGGGGIGGTIANNQIAIGAVTADTIEGDPAFLYDGNDLSIDGVKLRGSGGADIRITSNSATQSGLEFYDGLNAIRGQYRTLNGDTTIFTETTTAAFFNDAGGADLYFNSVVKFSTLTDGIAIPAAQRIYLDGGTDTYIREVLANRVQIVGNGAGMATFDPTFASLGNYTFDTDQTVGAGQDNFVLTYDDGTGQISLEAAAGGGGSPWTYRLVVGTSATAVAGDFIVASSTSAVTITLPASVANDTIIVKKTGATGTVTVDGNASELIDGALTFVLGTQYDSITLIADGTGWHIV